MKRRSFIITWLLLIGLLFMMPSMSQAAWTDDVFGAAHDVQTDMQAIEDNFAAIKANFASASEPSSPVAGMWWYDTTNGILKFRNAANTAWQYVWDVTNNQPMGTVTTTGTVSYAGTQLLSSVTLSRGTTATQVATTGFNYNITAGAPLIKGPVIAGTALASGTVPTNKWAIYLYSIDGSGVISSTAGSANFTTGYVDEATAIADMPATPGGTCRLGYVTLLTYSGQPFIGGTDALYGGTGGNPASATNYYPDTPGNTYTGNVTPTPSAYSGVYYVKASYRNYLTTPTVNLNSLGAKTIVKANSAALTPNDIVDGHDMILRYDGTYMVLTNPSGDPPVGSVITTFEDACPTGYLELDGSAISRSTYARLYSKYWNKYGSGDGSTTFTLPDVRGRFLRGYAHGSANDPDRASRTDRGDGTTGDGVGTLQSYTYQSHNHTASSSTSSSVSSYGSTAYGNAYTGGSSTGNAGDGSTGLYNVAGLGISISSSTSTTVNANGGNETRPINIGVLYCVKY